MGLSEDDARNQRMKDDAFKEADAIIVSLKEEYEIDGEKAQSVVYRFKESSPDDSDDLSSKFEKLKQSLKQIDEFNINFADQFAAAK